MSIRLAGFRDVDLVRVIRSFAFVLMVGCAAGAARGQAFVLPVPGSDGVRDEGGGTRLPTAGRRESRLFRTALKHLEAGRADEAVVSLQTILDAEADGFYETEENPQRLVSLRGEVVRTLEGLKGEAKQAYELRYGPAAKGLLAEAVAANDGDRIADVARRFPATEAGRDATFRVAAAELDAGEPLPAAARLEGLREVVAGRRRAGVLLRLAVCYGRLRDQDRRDAALRELGTLGERLAIADEEVLMIDVESLRRASMVGSTDALPTGRRDWAVAGGSVDRANHRMKPEGRTAEWSVVGLSDPFRPPGGPATATDTRLAKWAAGAALVELAGGRPAVPTAQPIAAGEMVFFRTPAGITAVDAATGKHLWRTLADQLCWDYLPEPAVATPAGEMAARSFVGQRLFSDATWGNLATDGRSVFAIEETGAASPLPPVPGTEVDEAARPVLPATFNRLAAYDAATGRRVWEAGGPVDEHGALAGAFFLGPPVPVGGRWYGLAESSGVTRLVAIDPSRPEGVLWSQPVAEHDRAVDVDSVLRTAGVSPCVAGGRLVCPVGPGLVVAIDPAMRSLVWAHVSEKSGEHRPADGSFVPGVMPPAPPEVIAAGGTVLIGSREGDLAAIDPHNGSVRWRASLERYLWMIGADDSTAFVQMAAEVVAVRLSDGTTAWETPAAVGSPAGRGVIVGDRLFVPLADRTLAVLDAGTGRRIATIASPHDEPLGNLIVFERTLVSQSAMRVVAVPLPGGGVDG